MKGISTIEIIKEIHRDKIVLIKIGSFYNAYFKDAIIMNYLFGYKIKQVEVNVNSCGFPVSSINSVKYVLEQKNISYILIDRAHNYEEMEREEFKENEYSQYYDKGYKYFYIKNRIDNISVALLENINSEGIKDLLNKIEEVINENRKVYIYKFD